MCWSVGGSESGEWVGLTRARYSICFCERGMVDDWLGLGWLLFSYGLVDACSGMVLVW